MYLQICILRGSIGINFKKYLNPKKYEVMPLFQTSRVKFLYQSPSEICTTHEWTCNFPKWHTRASKAPIRMNEGKSVGAVNRALDKTGRREKCTIFKSVREKYEHIYTHPQGFLSIDVQRARRDKETIKRKREMLERKGEGRRERIGTYRWAIREPCESYIIEAYL